MPEKPLPQFVAPMQASIAKEPFDNPDWIFETKLDGYWAIAVIDSAGKAQIVGIKIVAESAFDGIKT
jgi:ATP-dependent DNA ligase